MHALIIEDESLIAMAIEDALRGCGFTSFDLAASAEESVAAAARNCPDLITADVELRPGCGTTAAQSICSDQPIPVLFITGSRGEVRVRMPGQQLANVTNCIAGKRPNSVSMTSWASAASRIPLVGMPFITNRPKRCLSRREAPPDCRHNKAGSLTPPRPSETSLARQQAKAPAGHHKFLS
jgi:CheY-like chemotaxis protein